MSGGLQYYPIFSGAYARTATAGSWTTMESSDFTDQNTGSTVPTGKRFQCVTFTNISSVGAAVTWGNSTAIVSGTSATNSIRVAPGESVRKEVFSLGGATGVQAIGVQVDPDLSTTNLGSGVNLTELIVFAEFGNT